MHRILLIISLMFLVACSESVQIQLAPQVNALVYGEEQPTSLTSENEAYKELNTWLSQNSDGWMGTSGRYPGGVYIKSADMGIQVIPQKVIVYLTQGGEPQARYVKHIGPDELNAVKSMGQ